MLSCLLSPSVIVGESLHIAAFLATRMIDDVPVEIYVDNAAARQLAHKEGVGRIRHLDLKLLFAQRLVKEKRLVVKPINGLANPADMFTKGLPRHLLLKHCEAIGLEEVPEAVRSLPRSRSTGAKGMTRAALLANLCTISQSSSVVAQASAATSEEKKLLMLVFVVLLLFAFVSGAFVMGACCFLRNRFRRSRVRVQVCQRGVNTEALGSVGAIPSQIFVSSHGERYHCIRDCTGLRGAKTMPSRRTPCRFCYG